MGFVKGGSKPSLIAGLGLGASYGAAGESDTAQSLCCLSCCTDTGSHRVPPEGEQGLRLRTRPGKQSRLGRSGDKPVHKDEMEGARSPGPLRHGLTCELLLPEQVQGAQLWCLVGNSSQLCTELSNVGCRALTKDSLWCKIDCTISLCSQEKIHKQLKVPDRLQHHKAAPSTDS